MGKYLDKEFMRNCYHCCMHCQSFYDMITARKLTQSRFSFADASAEELSRLRSARLHPPAVGDYRGQQRAHTIEVRSPDAYLNHAQMATGDALQPERFEGDNHRW